MKHSKIILFFVGVLITINSYAQNDSIIKNGYVTIAVLVVDYYTYQFEGGHIANYSCPDCPKDSIPFSILYEPPADTGYIIFKLASSEDKIFQVCYYWNSEAEISYPGEFSTQGLFGNTDQETKHPGDLRYIDYNGKAISDENKLSRADSAWQAIDSLEITALFAGKGFKSAVYFFPQSEVFWPPITKWIFFLYHNAQPNALKPHHLTNTQARLYPNPLKAHQKLNLDLTNTSISHYQFYNALGQSVLKGKFSNSNHLHQLDISSLTPGLYVLRLVDEVGKEVMVGRVVVE